MEDRKSQQETVRTDEAKLLLDQLFLIFRDSAESPPQSAPKVPTRTSHLLL